MNRRNFILSAASVGIGTGYAHGFPFLLEGASDAAKTRAHPSADQLAWQDLELGMFVHFAPNTWQDLESDDLSTPLSRINPRDLDTDQWARTAVALGARYLVFVAKHQGGFCMWQTKTTEYSIRNTPWKSGRGDVLAEVAASCKRHGLKLGVYVCPRDDHFGAKTGGVCATPEMQARYDTMYRQQLTEVLGNYGPMVEVWFDGSTRTPVSDLLARYQPHSMVFQGSAATIRWVGNEDGYAPYPCWNGIDAEEAKTGTATSLNSDPSGAVWMPNEVDVSIRRPDWFWSTKNESKVLNVDQLLSIYYRSVGRGAQLLLNIPADRSGLLPAKDTEAATQLGAEIWRRFQDPVAETAGSGSSLLLSGKPAMPIDTMVLAEDLRFGERVRSYRLEGYKGGSWTLLGSGSAIGHKRIQPIASAVYDKVRLTITESVGRPHLRSMVAFHTGQEPPTAWDAPAQLWAANLVGRWESHTFHLDLTSQIKAAAQYRLRFIPLAGTVKGLNNLSLRLHGVDEPDLLKRSPAHVDELVLDITGVAETVAISGTVVGAERGSVTLQKL
ncbi:alpha-L-fucosidase [Terriglobus roseus]|nr:alpha-L-fucosidase [Terriglobus roseus]